DTGRPPASKRLLNAMGDKLPTSNRGGKQTRQSRTGAYPMRSLAVWTTTAAVALFGFAAYAQTTPAAASAPAAAAQSSDVQTAITGYARYQNDVTDLRTASMNGNDALETALDRVGRHNKDDMTRGFIGYGSQVAAQSPAFVQGVRD